MFCLTSHSYSKNKQSIESLEKAEAMEEYAKVLRTALHLSHSFPKMQVKELVNLICNSWELLCDMSSVIRSSASRKLTNLTTNKKELKTKKTKSISQQDEKKLCEDAESLLLKSSAICIESNMELYRIRALKKLYAENYKWTKKSKDFARIIWWNLYPKILVSASTLPLCTISLANIPRIPSIARRPFWISTLSALSCFELWSSIDTPQ